MFTLVLNASQIVLENALRSVKRGEQAFRFGRVASSPLLLLYKRALALDALSAVHDMLLGLPIPL
ncbi:MAG: hypothetical protein JO254_15400 [Pseudolabrys sp.]|nr:hypothetical protein [Pseudolabrys sp.]